MYPRVFHGNAKGYSSVGRATVSKTVGRGFESCCPCHFAPDKAFSIHPIFYKNGYNFPVPDLLS